MTDTVENLILDLIEWLDSTNRTYQETMDARRTSCPRLPVWEDATDRGFVEHDHADGRSLVRATPAGLAFLKEKRPGAHGQERPAGDRTVDGPPPNKALQGTAVIP